MTRFHEPQFVRHKKNQTVNSSVKSKNICFTGNLKKKKMFTTLKVQISITVPARGFCPYFNAIGPF